MQSIECQHQNEVTSHTSQLSSDLNKRRKEGHSKSKAPRGVGVGLEKSREMLANNHNKINSPTTPGTRTPPPQDHTRGGGEGET